MKNENTEKIREKVLELIESEFESDAAFERALSLPEKTVNNWRRGRSSSYMKMLPRICDCFSISIGGLLDMPVSSDTSELSDDETELLNEYRKASCLTQKEKEALKDTLLEVIRLYLTSREKPQSRGKRSAKK